jgi:hypothetical protein
MPLATSNPHVSTRSSRNPVEALSSFQIGHMFLEENDSNTLFIPIVRTVLTTWDWTQLEGIMAVRHSIGALMRISRQSEVPDLGDKSHGIFKFNQSYRGISKRVHHKMKRRGHGYGDAEINDR